MASNHRGTVILFYKYINIPEPELQRDQQKKWLQELGITGRLRVGKEGLNGNLYGSKAAIEEYKNRMEASQYFQGIDYKHSLPLQAHSYSPENGESEDPFDGILRVRLAEEITGTGPMREHLPTALGGNGGIHLAPKDFHELVKRAKVDDNIVVIDTRNHYETIVGKFDGAIDPKLRCFGQFPRWIEANKESLRGKKVGMYCTGGIRCEKASTYVKSLGLAEEVYQLQGGISNYLAHFSSNAGKDKGVFIDSIASNRTSHSSSGSSSSNDEYSVEKMLTKIENEEPICCYEGVNFQFDNRFSEATVGAGDKMIGDCCYCFESCSRITEETHCSVCSDLILICHKCYSLQNSRAKIQQAQVVPTLYCPEHMLLSDEWQNYLKLLMRTKWNPQKLHLTRKHLELMVDVPDYIQRNDWKDTRRENLMKQIERVTQFLDAHPEYKYTPLEEELGFANETTRREKGFVPFIPFLNP